MRFSIGRVVVTCLALAIPLGALADKKSDGSLSGHPNLLAAQKLAAQAFDKLTAAQQANEYDLGGHAAKAKTLLEQVKKEINLAAAAADDKDKPKR